jgi:L-ascorbate 6-phosphate lactonase
MNMIDIAERFQKTAVNPGEFSLIWLGQAGFMIKNSAGKTAAVDPYLSDAVERICGLKRLMMPVMEPEELNPDVILITHHDEDHLDMDILPGILARNPKTKLLAPERAYSMCRKAGIPEKQLVHFDQGEKVSLDGFDAEAVFADHGDHAPDAVGILLTTEGRTVYFSGDTSFQCDRMKYAASKNIDVLILPINGQYGNMNSFEAADLAKMVGAKLTIPSHFWTFIRHGGDPYAFDLQMRAEAPELPYYFMCQGEIITWNGEWGAARSEQADFT